MVCEHCNKKIDDDSRVCQHCGKKVKRKSKLNILNLRKKTKKETKKENITFFNNKWEVEELLGEGSFGKVYKVKKEEFGLTTYAAIKTIKIPQHKSEIQELKNEGMSNEEIKEYFQSFVKKWLDEIKLMQNLKSSVHVVNIEDYEVIENPKEIGWNINIRMELLQSIEDYFKTKDVTNKDVLKIGIDISKALEHCKKFNIIHRDIKPDNIFISDLGDYKLGDFGIARNLEKTTSGLSKKGTYTYMAPEVYKGEKYNNTIDIYSLGIVLYRYYNFNRIPFLPTYPKKITYEDREESVIKRMSGEKILPPANGTATEAEIILKSIEFNPKKRYQTATDFKKDLEKIYSQIEERVIFDGAKEKEVNKTATAQIKNSEEKIDDIAPLITPESYVSSDNEEKLNKTISIFDEEPKKDKKEDKKSKKEKNLNKTISILDEKDESKKLTKTVTIFDDTNEDKKSKKENNLNKTVSILDEEDKSKKLTKTVTIFDDTNEEKEEDKSKKLTKTVTIFDDTNEEKEEDNNDKIVKSKKKKIKIEKINKSNSKSKRKFILISILLLMLLIILLLFLYFKFNFVKVPDLVGKTTTEALETLEENELVENIIEKEVSDKDVGKVIKQEEKGKYVKKESVIDITIGVSKNKVKMINLVGLKEEEAEEKLEELGLTIKVIEEFDDEVKDGYVISQVIEEGKEVAKGSTVEVLVSKGQENQEESKKEESKKEETQQKNWSNWVEKLPSGVNKNNYVIETKTQYRKRDKSTTTSTSSTMSGWTKYDETVSYGNWGSKKTTYSKVTSNDTTKIVATKNEYVYYHEVNKYSDGSYGIDSIPYHNHQMTCSFTSSTELPVLAYNQDKGGQVMYKTVWKCGDCGFSGWFLKSKKTKTTYQTRTKTTTYYFYKWSSWSSWGDSKINENNNRDVETRTLYRYKER